MIGSKIISLRRSIARDLATLEHAAREVRASLDAGEAFSIIPKTHHLRAVGLARIADNIALLAELESLQDLITRGACDCPPCVAVNAAARVVGA